MRPVEESTVPASPDVKTIEPQWAHEYRNDRAQGGPGPRPPGDRDPTPPPGGLIGTSLSLSWEIRCKGCRISKH